MQTLGIRTAPKQIRYAITHNDNGTVRMLNLENEHLLKIPANIDNIPETLNWLESELERIIRQNQEINQINLKVNEYARSESGSSRVASYLDAIVLLVASKNSIPVATKLYSQLGTKRKDVKNHAEHRVAKTETHWNEQIADAIIAAWVGSKS